MDDLTKKDYLTPPQRNEMSIGKILKSGPPKKNKCPPPPPPLIQRLAKSLRIFGPDFKMLTPPP